MPSAIFTTLQVPVVFPLMKESLGVSFRRPARAARDAVLRRVGHLPVHCRIPVDHYGARRILFLGMGIVSGAVLLCGFALSWALGS